MGQLRGYLYVWDTHTLFAAAPDLVNKPHGHYAASIILAPDHPLKLGYGGEATSAHGFLPAPNLVHQQDASQTRLLVLHLDPDSPEYRTMAPLLGPGQGVGRHTSGGHNLRLQPTAPTLHGPRHHPGLNGGLETPLQSHASSTFPTGPWAMILKGMKLRTSP